MDDLYFDPITRGFMDSAVHGDSIPGSALVINRDYYKLLMEGQRGGASITVNDDGLPVLQGAPPLSEESLRNLISSYRHAFSTCGVTRGSVRVSTSLAGQVAVSSAVMAAQMDDSYRCVWKTLDGFVEVGSKEIVDMALAIRRHIQACFNREAELLAHLEAGTLTESMLDEGWPN